MNIKENLSFIYTGTLSAPKQHSFVHFQKELQFQIEFSSWRFRELYYQLFTFFEKATLITFFEIGPGLIKIAGYKQSI